jgi:hypothetical protein
MASFEIYHTTENRGNHSDIEKTGGVFGDTTELFLGRGYYYWEDNYSHALVWGQKRYKGHFYIFKGNMELDLDKMFDISFMGHNNYIRKLYAKFILQYKKKTKSNDFYLGLFIDFVLDLQNDLRKINQLKDDELFFPFLYSKGIDHSASIKTESEQFSRRDIGKSWYYSKPLVFFCVYSADNLKMTNFVLTKTAGYQQ